MADKQSHIRQWQHNRKFVSAIPPAFHDWIITATFYTALHAVDALLAHDGVTVVNHEARNLVLTQSNRYQQLNRHFHPLYNLSRTIRYLADPARWVAPEDIEPQVIRRYLYPIEKSVQKLIGQDLALGAVTLRPPGSVAAPTETIAKPPQPPAP